MGTVTFTYIGHCPDLFSGFVNIGRKSLNVRFGIKTAASENNSERYVEVKSLMPDYVRRLRHKGGYSCIYLFEISVDLYDLGLMEISCIFSECGHLKNRIVIQPLGVCIYHNNTVAQC